MKALIHVTDFSVIGTIIVGAIMISTYGSSAVRSNDITPHSNNIARTFTQAPTDQFTTNTLQPAQVNLQ